MKIPMVTALIQQGTMDMDNTKNKSIMEVLLVEKVFSEINKEYASWKKNKKNTEKPKIVTAYVKTMGDTISKTISEINELTSKKASEELAKEVRDKMILCKFSCEQVLKFSYIAETCDGIMGLDEIRTTRDQLDEVLKDEDTEFYTDPAKFMSNNQETILKLQLEKDFKERMSEYDSKEEFYEDNLEEMRGFLNSILKVRNDHDQWVKVGKKGKLPANVSRFLLEGIKQIRKIFSDGDHFINLLEMKDAAMRLDEMFRFKEGLTYMMTSKEAQHSLSMMEQALSEWKKIIKKETGEEVTNIVDNAKRRIEKLEKNKKKPQVNARNRCR